MNENSIKKCRACLKGSTKTFPLTKYAVECSPIRTYGQLLMEYANFEYVAEYERFMPQFLCILCCRALRNTYSFIKQAQYCNNKLVNVISKKLDCLKESSIDLPENDSNLEIYSDIKMEDDAVECHTLGENEGNAEMDEFYLETLSAEFEVTEDSDIVCHKQDSEEVEVIDIKEKFSKKLPMECSTTSDYNKIDSFQSDSNESLTATVCPVCKKPMNSRDNLIKHIRTQHDIDNPGALFQKSKTKENDVFVCKFCSSIYTNKYTYLYHLKRKHNIDETKEKETQKKDKIIKCRSCDYTARTYAALNYHNRSKHGTENDKFKCEFCNHLFLKKSDLLTHVKNSHKEQIKMLKAEVETKSETQSGIATSNSPKLEPDNFIAETEEYSSDDDVPLIKKTELKKDNEQFSDEEFIRDMLNIKKRQTKTSTNSLARRCGECGNIYKNYRALYAHQRHVHISEDKYSLCPHCGKKYKRKTDLRIHIEKTHLPKNSTEIAKQPPKVRVKNFMCTECSYACTTISTLNIHINRHHTGEKPYKCDICFKSFVVKFDLKTHRYIHTGERPYQCPICSKGFRDSSHMVRHKRVHSNERAYKCKECGKSFTQSYNLSLHKRTHLKEKKLNCIVCNKVFENRSLLNIHRINENHRDVI